MLFKPTRPTCDAEALGAECSKCPLRGAKPVPPELTIGGGEPRFVILGEGPGRQEDLEGQPFIGASGRLLDQGLNSIGVRRAECHITNATLCLPPKGIKPKQLGEAVKHCRPRLFRELEQLEPAGKFVVALGGQALNAMTGRAKIIPWRGVPISGKKFKKVLDLSAYTVFPTLHPAFCLRKPCMQPVFRHDLRRATWAKLGFFQAWAWPALHIHENDAMLGELFRMQLDDLPLGVDVETSGIRHDSGLLCIGLANKRRGISCPWPPARDDIKRQVLQLLAGPLPKVMHNGQHDVYSLDHFGIPVANFWFDTLLAHALVAPQVPHDLGFVASCHTLAPRWKSDFKVETDLKGAEAFTKRDPEELRTYNLKDAFVTARLVDPLEQQIMCLPRGQEQFKTSMKLSHIAIEMRKAGLKIDRERLGAHDRALTTELERADFDFHQAVSKEWTLGKNGQHPSLQRLFFGELKVRPQTYSDTGRPVLDINMLSQIAAGGAGLAATAAGAAIRFRKASKLRETYIRGLELDVNDRLHPVWKTHGAVTGRWSSSPNCQNWPEVMRDLVVPHQPDWWIVGADYSQIELRIAALVAQDEEMLAWYKQGIDVHIKNAALVFKVPEDQVSKAQRTVAKCVAYGFIYNISDDVSAVHAQLLKKFPTMTRSMVQYARTEWFKQRPAIEDWQRHQIHEVTRLSYTEEPLSGRRLYFHDGHVDANQALNFPVQGMAGTLMNQSVVTINEKLDWKTESLLAQIHDAAYLCGPNPDRLAQVLVDSMEQEVTIGGHTMKFPVDVKRGRDMKNLA